MKDRVILRTENLCRNFGALQAVKDVNLVLHEGEVRAIIGPNGAGKSTCMDLILNRTHASSGHVYFNDVEVTNVPPYSIAQQGMYKCFQISQLFLDLTVFENIQLALIRKKGVSSSFLPRKDDWMREEVLDVLQLVDMGHLIDETAKYLSYGDQRRLEIAITLAMEPTLLILDEPTSGVARAEGYQLMQMTRDLAEQKGITVIFIEHDMDIVFKYADTISILDHGQLIATDVPEEIHKSDFVQKAYTGGEDE